jgi:uncharacterized protein (DUF305 family)
MMGAMDRMHAAMNDVPMTGDVDRDFVALMIPHHQSAVEMAQAYLESGRDPQLRQLAAHIVATQQAEIARMSARGPMPAGAAERPAPHAGH